MNETFGNNESFFAKYNTSPVDAIKLITKKMLETRPRKDVVLKPYTKSKVYQKGISGPIFVDFKEIYIDIEDGEECYLKVSLFAEDEEEIYISNRFFCQIESENSIIFSNDNRVTFETAPSDIEGINYYFVPVKLHIGNNTFIFKSVCDNNICCGEFYAAFKRYPLIWSRDYLFSTRAIIKEGYTEGEEGVLYKRGSNGDWLPCIHPPKSDVDLNEIFPNGSCIYALTYLKKGEVTIKSSGPFVVFVNGKDIFKSKTSGYYNVATKGEILVKTSPCENRVITFSGDHCIPFLSNYRNGDIKVILSGSYGFMSDNHLEICYAPETEIQFTAPYPNGCGDYTFWRGCQPDTFIRPYLDGIFYGQWFYAISVGIWGLIESSRAVGDADTLKYAIDSMSILSDYFDYANWDYANFDNPTLLPRGCDLRELDPCGAIGLTIYEAYQLCGDKNMRNVIAHLKDALQNDVPRFGDRTFYRIKTMWSDDMFMSIPLLMRLGLLYKDNAFFDDAIAQAEGFHKRLWMDDKKLYSHILFVEQNQTNCVPWGRGNGWVIIALSEILLVLPKEHKLYYKVLDYYREFAEGIKACQDESGLWHQVLNEKESYLETSCSAMFCTALARGIKNGWIDKNYEKCVRDAWEALLKYCVDYNGNTYGVCLGSGCAMDSKYYYDIPTHKNDDHGTGIILLAAKEILDL